MFEYYGGARTGLSDSDVQAVQALYGARAPDASEGLLSNDTLAAATRLNGPVEADLTTLQDVDFFRFQARASGPMTVRLQTSGLSLLAAQVTVYDGTGRAVGSASSVDPLNGDLTVFLGDVKGGMTYTVQVRSARGDAFGVGAYRLQVDVGVPKPGPIRMPSAEGTA